MKQKIDLRSDTVTCPSPAMRQAMANARVGDDVWGEDPTVKELQERVAELLGKEQALFVPSGTMANQVALLVHTHPGDEVLLGWGCHCYNFESGAGGALAGVQFRVLGQNGFFTAKEMQEAILPPDIHFAPPSLVWIENTHNRAGGRIFPLPEVASIAQTARQQGLKIHLDGARLLNAAVAAGHRASDLTQSVDSTSICLSKGLGAPAGSVLAGTTQFIAQARRYRKMLGGGMRQVGILAAAGLYALSHNVTRLSEDHENAQLLAQGLSSIKKVNLDPEKVETNIVIFELDRHTPDAATFIRACAERDLLFSWAGPRQVRAVTHLDISRTACLAAVQMVRDFLS